MNLSANAQRSLVAVFWAVAAILGYAITRSPEIAVSAAVVAVLLVMAALLTPAQLVILAVTLIPFRVIESLLPIIRGGVTLADGFLLAFVVSALARKRVFAGRRVSPLLVVVIVALVAVGAISMFNSGFYGVGVRKLGRIAVIGLTFLAASHSLGSRDAERAAGAFVLSAAASSIVALGFTLRAAVIPGIGVLRLWGGVEDPNHVSVVLAAALLIAVAWRPTWVPRWLWLASSLLILVGQAASLSRGGAAALAVGLGVLILVTLYARFLGRRLGLWSRSGALLLVLASIAALGAAFIPADFTGAAVLRYQGILDPQTDATGALRFRLWNAGFAMLANSPILGVGPGAFGLALVASGAFTSPWEAHSSIVEIAVETGYLGAGIVVLALIVGGWLSLRSFGTTCRDDLVSDESVALSSGLVACAAAIIVGGASLSNILYQPLFASIIVMLIATLTSQVREE